MYSRKRDAHRQLQQVSAGRLCPKYQVVQKTVGKFDFSVSKDHRWLAYTQASNQNGDIILIEGRPESLGGL